MLDALLKNKFYRKCKSAINTTKVRIEIIKRKRNAMQKYLKNDVADLLKDGLDINAYFRAEGLFVELNLLSCYDIVDKFCDHIKEFLLVMSKQRECPEECNEAVSSLIFAAARFADLPELRELRSMFIDRYGNTLDSYASKEFVERLKSTHPTKDATIDIMHHIATEAGLQWDSKATEEKLYNPLAFGQARSNVGDTFETRKTPEDGNLSYVSNNQGKVKSFKDIQEDIQGRKGQETEPEIRSHVLEKEIDEKETFNYNQITPYTKSRIHDHGNKDAEQIRHDPVNDHGDFGISEGGSITSSTENDNSEHEEKGKGHARLDEDQLGGEERWLDTLLMYYNRNKDKLYSIIRNKESTKSPPKEDTYSRVRRRGASWDFRSTRAELSFPTEQKRDSEETNKNGHTRSASLPPEMLKSEHVHPKLPDDYDYFLAHLADIKNGGN